MSTKEPVGRNWRGALDTLGAVVFIVAAGTLTYSAWARIGEPVPTSAKSASLPPTRPTDPPLPSEPIDVAGLPSLGAATAKVAAVLYSDFECPFCRRLANETLPRFRKEMVDTGRVRLVFRHFPLSIHPMARYAASAAECAEGRGRFWDMHDQLFERPAPMTRELPLAVASDLGLPLEEFQACLIADETLRVVDADIASAKAAGVRGTPTLLIGTFDADGRVTVKSRLKGAQPPEALAQVVDAMGR